MSRVLQLVCHPDTPPARIEGVSVELTSSDDDDLLLGYSVRGSEHLLLPEWKSSVRKDGLWHTTCFELFLRPEGQDGYYEFNFSPSTQWAAYSFTGYREGMREWVCAVDPLVERVGDRGGVIVEADIDLGGMADGPLRLGLCAVIEEKDGARSYWALAHPPGRPDFHHPACFAFELPAPRRP